MNLSRPASLADQILRDQAVVRRVLFESGGLPRLDITMAQLRALLVLALRRQMPIGQLGTTLGMGKASATLLVNSLVRSGLVERAEQSTDRRYTLAALTPAGQSLLDELRAGRRDQALAWLAALDEADLDALARGMHALAAVASACAVADTA